MTSVGTVRIATAPISGASTSPAEGAGAQLFELMLAGAAVPAIEAAPPSSALVAPAKAEVPLPSPEGERPSNTPVESGIPDSMRMTGKEDVAAPPHSLAKTPPARAKAAPAEADIAASVEQLLALARSPIQSQAASLEAARGLSPEQPAEAPPDDQPSTSDLLQSASAVLAPDQFRGEIAKPIAAEAAQIDTPELSQKQAAAPILASAASAPVQLRAEMPRSIDSEAAQIGTPDLGQNQALAPIPTSHSQASVAVQQLHSAQPTGALLARLFTPVQLSSDEGSTEPLPGSGWSMVVPAARESDTAPTQIAPGQPLASFQAQPATAVVSAESMVEHQLDLATDGAWLDQLAKDIAAAGEDGAPLRFRLNPETLGSLRVEVTQQRDGAAVRLTADTEAARAIIADAQPKLLAEARAQGVRISEAHVDLGHGSASGDPRRQQSGPIEPQLRTARSLQDKQTSDGNPTERRSDRFA